jgi:hypothetical protein
VCSALRKDGRPCTSPAKEGHAYCGRHLPRTKPAPAPAARCSATCKDGLPCVFHAKEGHTLCGRHLRYAK